MKRRVIGIGNALTDMLVNLSNDNVLTNYQLAKGSMSLVDSQLQTDISKSVAGCRYSLSLGGSAANTIRAMAQLGTEVGFIGKVGYDETGDFYEQALRNIGVVPYILRSEHQSGKCVSLVSTDGERTLVTHLGAAADLQASDVDAEVFEGYDYLYIEGFLVQDHELIRSTVQRAKERGLKVAIDLASFNVVEENRDFLHDIIERYVDIIFANEDEARTFTGKSDPSEALQYIGRMCELAIVKIGMRGALIKCGDEVTHVGIMAAAKRVDTTGAGDFYAAGFMAGLCSGLSLRQCGTLGAIAAGKVIEIVGTTLSDEAWSEILSLAEGVRSEQYLF
jgi:sugar/nucleoside kinase (ribokinase family)